MVARLGRSATLAVVVVVVCVAFAASASRATTAPGVARLSLIRGTVEIRRADAVERIRATTNVPLVSGDRLTTRDGARAEVEFGYGAALRVAPDTEVGFVAVERERERVGLSVGTVEFRGGRNAARIEIETSQATIRSSDGLVRVAVARDGATTVTTRDGFADVVTAGTSERVGPGAALAITNGGPARVIVAAGDDAFDRWNDERDRTQSVASTDDMPGDAIAGTGDLRTYGRWIDDARYGRVWSPYERAGWAPFHDGRFVWEPYYGWTWVATEPWGWAPYHYGNWFYAANAGWCWYPGIAAYGPYAYRPAVVAFFSFGGPGSSGFGNVGWVPLAPYEPFVPWYGDRNVTVVNTITNVTVVGSPPTQAVGSQVFRIYHNAGAPGGAVVVERHAFSSGNFASIRPVAVPALIPSKREVPIVERPIVARPNLVRPAFAPPDVLRRNVTAPIVRHVGDGTPPAARPVVLDARPIALPANAAPPGTPQHLLVTGGSNATVSRPAEPHPALGPELGASPVRRSFVLPHPIEAVAPHANGVGSRTNVVEPTTTRVDSRTTHEEPRTMREAPHSMRDETHAIRDERVGRPASATTR
ncbi:MAG: FecR domain-containing protein [Vulcanimicrobiaceae bacterium]